MAALQNDKMNQIAQGVRFILPTATARMWLDPKTGLRYTEAEAKGLAKELRGYDQDREKIGLNTAGDIMKENAKADAKSADEAKTISAQLQQAGVPQAPPRELSAPPATAPTRRRSARAMSRSTSASGRPAGSASHHQWKTSRPEVSPDCTIARKSLSKICGRLPMASASELPASTSWRTPPAVRGGANTKAPWKLVPRELVVTETVNAIARRAKITTVRRRREGARSRARRHQPHRLPATSYPHRGRPRHSPPIQRP